MHKPKALVADMQPVFEACQVYIIISQVQNISELYLRKFPPKKLMVSSKALEETKKKSADLLSKTI